MQTLEVCSVQDFTTANPAVDSSYYGTALDRCLHRTVHCVYEYVENDAMRYCLWSSQDLFLKNEAEHSSEVQTPVEVSDLF